MTNVRIFICMLVSSCAIEMRGKGLVLALVMTIIMLQMPVVIDAGHTGITLTWQSGLQIKVDVEDIDFWTTDSVSKIYFTLRLLNVGPIVDFKTLILEITVVTEVNYTEIVTVDDPWNAVGESTKLVAEFNIASENINNAAWETYVTQFYYNFSVIADTAEYTDSRFYTPVYEGTHLTISTIGFIVFWPFPPIILVACVFWVLYFVLRKFNTRYEGLEPEGAADQEKPT